MSQPAISKHLKVLERAGLVTRSQDAQRRPCHLEPAPLREAEDWLQRYADAVEARFARMDDLLAELVATRAPRTPSASPTRTPSSNRKKKKESHR
jgi:DNA-binding transcriptional ArsR family regulator